MNFLINLARRFVAGCVEPSISKVEGANEQIANEIQQLRCQLTRSEQRTQKTTRLMVVATVLMAIATAMQAVLLIPSCRSARLETAAKLEKAFYKPSLQISTDTARAIFTLRNPGERAFEEVKVAYAVAHVPSASPPNPAMTLSSQSYLGIVYGGEALGFSLKIPETNDNVVAFAVCEVLQRFNNDVRTNRAAAIKYRVHGGWHDYRGGGGEPVDQRDRDKWERFLTALHQFNRKQPSEAPSNNW